MRLAERLGRAMPDTKQPLELHAVLLSAKQLQPRPTVDIHIPSCRYELGGLPPENKKTTKPFPLLFM